MPPRSQPRTYLVYALILSLAISTVSCASGRTLANAVPGEALEQPPEPPTPLPVAEQALPTPAESVVTPVVAGEAATPEMAPVATAVPAVAPLPATAGAGPDRYAELKKSIAAVLADLNGEWGIGVVDLATGDTLLMNADRAYPAASQYKLLLLYEAYRQIEAGTLQLDQMTRMIDADYADSIRWDEELKVGDRVAVKGLLRVIAIQSSNAAAHALNRLMGLSPTAINGAAQQLGLPQTRMPASGEAVTSVRDLVRFYGMLYGKELISPKASESLMGLLKEQQINDRIPARLPRGVKVAHKTGNLPGVVNDAGIIFGPRTDVTLIVLNDGADYEPGTAGIGRIGQLVYNWLNR